LAQNECEKRVLPNYVDKKLQICKMSELHIFVTTNICNQIFVTFGRIGTWTDLMQILVGSLSSRKNPWEDSASDERPSSWKCRYLPFWPATTNDKKVRGQSYARSWVTHNDRRIYKIIYIYKGHIFSYIGVWPDWEERERVREEIWRGRRQRTPSIIVLVNLNNSTASLYLSLSYLLSSYLSGHTDSYVWIVYTPVISYTQRRRCENFIKPRTA
jgi:hypothetical protein